MKLAETEYQEPPISAEHALWIAVIDQAISDSLFRPNMKTIERQASTPAALTGAARRIALERIPIARKKSEPSGIIEATQAVLRDEPAAVAKRSKELILNAVTRERDEARDWLLGNTKDFRDVCYLASMDPDGMLEKMQALSRQHWVLDDITRKKVALYRDGYCKSEKVMKD
jgi:hypothetical protein